MKNPVVVSALRRALLRSRGDAVLAGASVAMAALTAFSALTPPIAARARALAAFEPDTLRAAGHDVSLVGALVLLALAPGLARGSRRAAARTVAVLYVLALAHAAKGLDLEEALLAFGLALVVRGRARPRDTDAVPASIAAGAVAVGALTSAFALEVGVLLVSGRKIQLGTAVVRAGSGLVDRATTGRAPEVVEVIVFALVAFGVAAGALALLAPLRSARGRVGHSAVAHEYAAGIVRRYGADSLAPFTLRGDKSFFFARGGFVAYRAVGRTAVVSGDPVGPGGSPGPILSAFRAWAEQQGWDVVLTAAGAGNLAEYRRRGFAVLRIGSESIVDPRTFTLEGRAVRKLRQSVSRLHRRGWTVELVRAHALTPAHVEEISAAEAAWRARQPRLSGWAMAMDRLWGAPEDAQDLYVLGRDPDGTVRAFLRFLPFRTGLSLDAMRRPEEAPNGLMEALVAAALTHAREHGIEEVSLNFAGFAHLMAADTALGRRQRVARWALRRMHGRFQLERLVLFNEKFSPRWDGRYLVYSARALRTRLPVAALRVLQAEAYVRPPRRGAPAREGWAPDAEPVHGIPAGGTA